MEQKLILLGHKSPDRNHLRVPKSSLAFSELWAQALSWWICWAMPTLRSPFLGVPLVIVSFTLKQGSVWNFSKNSKSQDHGFGKGGMFIFNFVFYLWSSIIIFERCTLQIHPLVDSRDLRIGQCIATSRLRAGHATLPKNGGWVVMKPPDPLVLWIKKDGWKSISIMYTTWWIQRHFHF